MKDPLAKCTVDDPDKNPSTNVPLIFTTPSFEKQLFSFLLKFKTIISVLLCGIFRPKLSSSLQSPKNGTGSE